MFWEKTQKVLIAKLEFSGLRVLFWIFEKAVALYIPSWGFLFLADAQFAYAQVWPFPWAFFSFYFIHVHNSFVAFGVSNLTCAGIFLFIEHLQFTSSYNNTWTSWHAQVNVLSCNNSVHIEYKGLENYLCLLSCNGGILPLSSTMLGSMYTLVPFLFLYRSLLLIHVFCFLMRILLNYCL